MFGLCKYKNLFGEPNTGLRKYRIMDIAVMDTVVVVAFVAVLTWAFSWPFWWTLLAVFLLGIVVHRMFCVRTGVDKLLFPHSEAIAPI
jgi:fatty acid desaturase